MSESCREKQGTGHMNTLAILRSSAEQVALSWEKPKPSTCSGLASDLQDGNCCEVVDKPWKRPPSLSRTHMVIGCRGHSATRWFVAAGVESRMVPSRILQNQSTSEKNNVSCQEKEKKKEKRRRCCYAETGWQRELLPGLDPNLCSRISKGNVTRIGMSRHNPRQIPQDWAASPKVGTLDPTLSRAYPLNMVNTQIETAKYS